MKNNLTQNKSSMTKKYAFVFLLTFSNIVCLIPYLSLDFYNQFLEAYSLTDGQMGLLVSCFGATAVPGYFLGGWLADIFNPKKLVVLSCLSTAAVSIAVVFAPSYYMLLPLYLCYGITSTLLYWSSYLKLIRMLGDSDEQGRLFGVTDIAYSIMTLLLQYGVLALTVTYLANNPMGFKIAILIYSTISIVVGIAIHFVIPANNLGSVKEDDSDKIKLHLIGKAMKMPLTWYLSLFTMGYFIIRSTATYINPFLTDGFGISVTFATAFATTIRMLALMVMSPLGGYIRDKMGGRSTPIVMTGGIGALIFSFVLAWIPMTASFAGVVMAISIMVLIFCALTSSCLYTPTSEGKVDLAITGTVLGIASAIGYSSDLWLYSLCGNWIDNMGNAGYTYIWYLTAGGAAIMIITGALLKRCYKKI